MAEVILNEKNFDTEVMQSELPVLVDFWATWCGPCRMLAPTIAQIAEEQAGKVKVCKVDVDECPQLAARFGISSIPTLLVFEHGVLKNQAVGVMPKAQVEALFA